MANVPRPEALPPPFDGVACLAKLCRNEVCGVSLSGPKLRRGGIDFRGVVEEWFLEPLVDNTAVFPIVETEHACEQHATNCEYHPYRKK
jgi:hypothetical protein